MEAISQLILSEALRTVDSRGRVNNSNGVAPEMVISVILGYSVKNTIGSLNKERISKVMLFLNSQLSRSTNPLDQHQLSLALLISNQFFKGHKDLVLKIVKHAKPYKVDSRLFFEVSRVGIPMGQEWFGDDEVERLQTGKFEPN